MTSYFNIDGRCGMRYQKMMAVIFFALIFSHVIVAAERTFEKPSAAINAKFVAGEVLVKFKPSMSMQAQQSSITNLGGISSLPVGKKSDLVRIKLQAGNNVLSTVQAYQADPNIEFAQPNYIYHASAIPNDASYAQLWGLKNSNQTIANPVYTINNPPGMSGSDIDAELAWDEITDCRSAIVAVLDSGINYTHQDLAANMWNGGLPFPNHGYDFIDNDNDPMPTGGSEDHGTHVAGTIGASGNNGLGISGVCWQASIMSVRVLGADGSGTTAGIVSGIEFAADNGADVINMSLGLVTSFDLAFNNAITYARDFDVVVSVSAGNDGFDIEVDNDGDIDTTEYPCSFTHDNLICVAALDQAYSLANFSNYGAINVDVGAPGTNVLSSYAGQQILDDFSGWTLGGDWIASNNDCSSFSILINPSDYCSDPRPSYAANTDDRAYKNFNLNLSGLLGAELNYDAQIDTETNFDFFTTAMKSGGGDPFVGGVTLQSGSGSTSNSLVSFNHNILGCNTSTCTLGFQLTSDGSIENLGVAVAFFEINTLQTNSSSYHLNSGTSMSSPHVAGIAAMVRAFNPNYSYVETVEAIKNGGESIAALSGITTTGRAANAMGALAYITQPTGLTAVVQ